MALAVNRRCVSRIGHVADGWFADGVAATAIVFFYLLYASTGCGCLLCFSHIKSQRRDEPISAAAARQEWCGPDGGANGVLCGVRRPDVRRCGVSDPRCAATPRGALHPVCSSPAAPSRG